jgi:hypothetical protein
MIPDLQETPPPAHMAEASDQISPGAPPSAATGPARWGLALLLVFTFAKGVLWAGLIAPLDAPDEPSHLNYIVQVRDGGLLPVVDLVSPAGLLTPPSTPLNQDARDFFALYNYKFFRSMPYESAQPPLYYWLAALWTRPIAISAATMPTLLAAARLLSVLLGTAAVLALWLACRWAWPMRGTLAWVAPLALTLSPQFTFTTATVSNDAGVLFWGALLLAVWAHGLKEANKHGPASRVQIAHVALALLVTAAGVLTKLTFVATIPASLLWIYWIFAAPEAAAAPGVRSRRWLVPAAGFLAGSGLLVLPWVLRNLRVYGEPTGARAVFDLIHRIYWDRMQFPAGQLFSQFPLRDFTLRSFRSFWALFGWASVWLADWVYWALAGFTVASLLGLLLRVFTYRRLPRTPLARLAALALISCLLAFANYVGYNSLVEFQPHMRYTFVALAPAVFLLALGLTAGPWGKWRTPLAGTFLALLAVANWLSIVALAAHLQDVLRAAGK